LKLHEYQAKALLASQGVSVPRGAVAFTPGESKQIAQELGTATLVVKAQIHAGGRGKGGGVQVVRGMNEVESAAGKMLGSCLVTHQTGPGGRTVSRVLIEEGLDITKELYLSLLLDRSQECLVMIASSAGGIDIEKVAADSPELITRESIRLETGVSDVQVRQLSAALGFEESQFKTAAQVMRAVYDTYTTNDATLVEINPLIVTGSGRVVALDAKITLDDNALFRHANLIELRDIDEEETLEIEASKHSLSYIRLNGNIGCMVNGAGLAMATMDIIKFAGGEPANFLDVGGGANAGQIHAAFKILISDENVTAVLINIFGGILRCDVLAKGVIAAVRGLEVRVPIVVRMEGTNVDQGRELLKDSGLNFSTASTMAEAADHVVALAAKAEA
tara:strand:- start:911 stop:2083 length:1173 start_codon:yes stop_codon:yes gene_type:complete